MSKILSILILLVVFFVLLFVFLKRNNKSAKITKVSSLSIPFIKELQSNPDISTDNWNLHKVRLEKFRRSQYKGLTFFVSPENRIYYLSEKGHKIYC